MQDMTEIKQDSLATLGFELTWTSDVAKHREFYFAEQVNFWRDLFPGEVYQALMGKKTGDQITLSFPAGDITRPYESKQIFTIHPRQFERRRAKRGLLEPRYGRF
jgi:hypothetical protein